MVTKLADVHSNVNTEKNVFYSAYLKGKIQYNDVDPDKAKALLLEDEKKDYFAVPGVPGPDVSSPDVSSPEVSEVEEKIEEETGKIVVTIHTISNPSSSDNLQKLEEDVSNSEESEEESEEESKSDDSV
jgi:hypothetical protein